MRAGIPDDSAIASQIREFQAAGPKNTQNLWGRGLFESKTTHVGTVTVLLWRVSRVVKHNQVFQSVSQSPRSYTTSYNTSMRAYAGQDSGVATNEFPILLISRQSWLTHGCPRVDPGYGDSEPCL